MVKVSLCSLLQVLLFLQQQQASCRRLQAPPSLPDGTTVPPPDSLPDGTAVAAGSIPADSDTIDPTAVVQGQAALEQAQQQQQQQQQQEGEGSSGDGDEEEDDLIAEYGNFYLPSSYEATDDAGQPNCGIALNASRQVCNRLIAKSSNLTCQCYNFCDGQLESCYNYGQTPPLSECDIQESVWGCRVNFTEPYYNQTDQGPEPCPVGYMCSRDSMQPCDQIRIIPVAAELGDVHAGMYCPGSEDRTKDNGYKLCEPGYYCPNSTTMIPCPDGYFCPHKTAFPEIRCVSCYEGDPNLQREAYGYIAIGCALALFLVFMLWRAFMGYNKELASQLADLQAQGVYSFRSQVMFRQRRKKLQALRPKLQVIEKRMKSMTDLDVSALSTERENGDIQFDAHKLFDALDADGNGELDYMELNHVLMLRPAALREFTNRMNQAAKEPPGTNTISRAVFVRFFLTALEASSHFEPTPQEAAQLFDQLTLEAKAERYDTNGGIPHEAFYKCESIGFLTQPQIHELLSKFSSSRELYGDDDDIVEQSRRPQSQSVHSSFRRHQSTFFGSPRFSRKVQRTEFIALYPSMLLEVTDDSPKFEKEGVDIAFENLCLTVVKGDKKIKVVNDVTGRLRSGTMTALMGGSGAGKTSLLNALCGRAHYGEVTGNIKINGQKSSIEEHADSVGFVPQDDIVFAELSVRENLIYAGKFQLPRGTSLQEIEDLADKSLAGLGLSRVQHNMVGDVNRRGVSGGEKKRVNIGLELMSRPKILFLDEPTSGLDSSSAMLVMQSMKTLVQVQGITVCSVIHQPRKTIFELFDSLVLLGAGGFLVYHGKVKKAHKYFWKLGYDLPEGESLADWLIDISTGSLKPAVLDDDHYEDSGAKNSKKEKKRKKQRERRARYAGFETSEEEDENGGGETTDEDEYYTAGLRHSQTAGSSEAAQEDPEMLASEAEKEAARRELLYAKWRRHFRKLSKKKKAAYEAPKPFDLPTGVIKPSFFSQLGYQIHRLALLAWRNWYAKLLDTTIIVGAVLLVSVLEGVVTPTRGANMNDLDYYAIAEPSGTLLEAGEAMVREFPRLFKYAIGGNQSVVQYAAKLGVLIAVLVGLTATKTITEKRNEFFREAGSGYDINAYFCAVNIVSTIEHSLQVIFSSMLALWLRNSIAAFYSYYLNFLLLAWLCVSWALLFPLLVQPKSVVLVTGFYCIFFSLLFSGGIDPIRYKNIYGSTGIALFSGLLSPTRYFIEAMAVAESKCLPVQSGFTNLGERLLTTEGATQVASFKLVAQGLNDFGNVIQQGCRGWYWGALPAFAVGCLVRWVAGGINHSSGRAQQSKKPIMTTLARNKGSQIALSLYLTVLIALIALAVWLILRRVS